jgi:hypothetical protein
MPTAAAQLEAFLAKYDPAVASVARAAVKKLRARLKGAHALVYDNYNALAIGFAPTDRASDVIFSIAVYPKYASLFLFQNAHAIPDPDKRLRGSGKTTRHIVLERAADLDAPAVVALVRENLARAKRPFDPAVKGMLIIKSISAKQRPRRPSGG